MKIVKITCDHCDRDLTTTTNCIDWRLSICNERIPSRGGAVTDMYIHPPIESGDKYFCGVGCMFAWFEKVKGK